MTRNCHSKQPKNDRHHKSKSVASPTPYCVPLKPNQSPTFIPVFYSSCSSHSSNISLCRCSELRHPYALGPRGNNINERSTKKRPFMESKSRAGISARRSEGIMPLLQNSAMDLEDLRTLITCRVCIRPLYEPYTISCGHTFCYSCLRQWFDRDRLQKTCPDCRTMVVQQPAPAYLVR